MALCALSETVLDPCWRWPRKRADDSSIAGTRALGLERRTTPILRDVRHETLVRSNCVIYAYRSTVLGDNVLVIGRGNTVIGRRCRVRGSDNVVVGPYAVAHGVRSEAIGRYACVIRVGGVCAAGRRLLSPRTEHAQESTLCSSSDGEGDLYAPPLSASATRALPEPAADAVAMPRAKSHEHRRRRRRRRRRKCSAHAE